MTRIIVLKLFLSGTVIYVFTRILLAIIFGNIKVRGHIRQKKSDPVRFWSAIKIESAFFLLFLLPISYAVLRYPLPLPWLFKYTLIIVFTIFFIIAFIYLFVTRSREKRRDASYIKNYFLKPTIVTEIKPQIPHESSSKSE
jgi:hypothetical protein